MRVTYRPGRNLMSVVKSWFNRISVEITLPAYRENRPPQSGTAVHSDQLGGNLSGFQLEARLSTYLGSVW